MFGGRVGGRPRRLGRNQVVRGERARRLQGRARLGRLAQRHHGATLGARLLVLGIARLLEGVRAVLDRVQSYN